MTTLTPDGCMPGLHHPACTDPECLELPPLPGDVLELDGVLYPVDRWGYPLRPGPAK